MKKHISFLLAMCMVGSLSSCQRSEPTMSTDSSGESGISSSSIETSEMSADMSDGTEISVSPSDSSSTKQQSGQTTKAVTGTTAPKAKVSVTLNSALPASTSEESTLLNLNPDRGFRLEISMDVQWLSTSSEIRKDILKVIDEQIEKCKAEQITVAQTYLYLDGYHGKSISEKGLACIQTIFDIFREKKLKMLLRFAYQRDCYIGGETNETMLGHISQLAPVVAKNKDMIYSYQAGFVGAWGEWHSDAPAADKPTIMKAIAEQLVPSDVYMMARLPKYKNLLSSSSSAYKRMGFNNDCFWGKMNSSAYGSDGFDPGTDAWQQVINESPYCPQDSELYWNAQCVSLNDYCDGFDALKEFSEHRMTSFSVLHSYLDAAENVRTSMGDWKAQTLTESWLKTNGIPYAPQWFKDKNGNDVKRNVFEFVRDYLGYKLEAQSIQVTGQSAPGQSIQIKMPIVNYGFSAAFNLESGFAILDENNKVVSTVKAGNPETWYVTSPTHYSDRTLLKHELSAAMTLPAQSGEYKLAFYLKNKVGGYARLGNKLEFANGYNILHTFVI